MKTYSQFRPTAFDCKGLSLPDQKDWLVVPVGQNRDSDCLSRSNFEIALQMLGGESDEVEVHRFGHWGPGWFEIIIVKPNTEWASKAREIEDRLNDSPILDEEHFSTLEMEEANEVWAKCYRPHERCDYIRHHRSQFSFRNWQDMISCIRGNYFAGYASDLLN